MFRSVTPKVVAAVRPAAGEVVYLTGADTWTPNLQEAEHIYDEAHGQIRLLDASMVAGDAVAPYLAEAGPAEPPARQSPPRRTWPAKDGASARERSQPADAAP